MTTTIRPGDLVTLISRPQGRAAVGVKLTEGFEYTVVAVAGHVLTITTDEIDRTARCYRGRVRRQEEA